MMEGKSQLKQWGLRVLLLAVLLAGAGAALSTRSARAADGAPQNPVVVYMFWGNTCPHCAEAKPFLVGLTEKYPSLDLRFYEIYDSEVNRELFLNMTSAYGFEASGVPTIFIGDQHWVGFSAEVSEPQLEAAIAACAADGCADAGAGIIQPGEGELTELEGITPAVQATPSAETSAADAANSEVINIPLIGKVDLSSESLFMSTLLIAFVDGFNPCSVWVLTMLLALTLHTGSRRKTLIIGLIYLTVTAGVYALFIAGLFTVFTVVSFASWIQIGVSIIALFFAGINIKDYFWYKEGLSFTISDEQKPGIARGMRRVTQAGNSLWGLISATVALSAGVSLVEFTCTAGFPVMWTNILAANNVSTLTFVLLLLEYMLIYQADELVIFLIAVFTLKASRIEEKEGRILKLISGMLMLTLAIVMLINPALLNDMGSAIIVFAIAFAVTGLILLVHRVILPRFGVWVGSERKRKRHQHHREN
jgi:thiol-disulfide isomerase/thioredoxin